MKPKPSLLPEVRPTDPVLGGGSLRGTGVGGMTGEGEEESAVPTSKRARATGKCTLYYVVQLMLLSLSCPVLTIRNLPYPYLCRHVFQIIISPH